MRKVSLGCEERLYKDNFVFEFMKKDTYGKDHKYFLDFIKNTTQKKVLIKKIKSRLKNLNNKSKREFVFTDIGAGDGLVTIPIIKFLKKSFRLKCYCIEPSEHLIKIFKTNYKEGVTFIQDNVEQIEIPKSDFILASHMIFYTKNIRELVNEIYSALQPSGVALIITTNKNSEDKNLRIKVRKKSKPFFDIVRYLKESGIKYKHEIVYSDINLKDCIELNEQGKNMINFFYHKTSKILTANDFIEIQKHIKKLCGTKTSINKIEDYIWIFK